MIDGTVVITCYNEGELIMNAINSLKGQTVRNFEIILINDSSVDEATNRICNDLKNSGLKLFYTTENSGPSVARNLGISMANTDVIIPLDADDTLPENAIENIIGYFQQHPECDFLFGNYKRIDLQGNHEEFINCISITDSTNFLDPEALWDNWNLLGMTPHRKKIWEKTGGYSIKYSYSCQDVDFQLRALMSDAQFHYINATLYNWRRSQNGINNSEKNKADLRQCWSDNIDFIIKYSRHFKDGFSIARQAGDYQAIRKWAYQEYNRHNRNYLVMIFKLSPFLLYPGLVYLYTKIKSKRTC